MFLLTRILVISRLGLIELPFYKQIRKKVITKKAQVRGNALDNNEPKQMMFPLFLCGLSHFV